MPGEDEILLPIRLDMDAMRADVARTKSELQRQGEELAGALNKPAAAGARATSVFQDFRREQTQQARTVNFFARELGDLGTVLGATAQETQLFTKGLSLLGQGFGIGLAIEATSLALNMIAGSFKEAADKAALLNDAVFKFSSLAPNELLAVEVRATAMAKATGQAFKDVFAGMADAENKFAGSEGILEQAQKLLARESQSPIERIVQAKADEFNAREKGLRNELSVLNARFQAADREAKQAISEARDVVRAQLEGLQKDRVRALDDGVDAMGLERDANAKKESERRRKEAADRREADEKKRAADRIKLEQDTQKLVSNWQAEQSAQPSILSAFDREQAEKRVSAELATADRLGAIEAEKGKKKLEIQQLYANLAITGGNEEAARKLSELQARYAEEINLVGLTEQQKLEIRKRYAKLFDQVDKEATDSARKNMAQSLQTLASEARTIISSFFGDQIGAAFREGAAANDRYTALFKAKSLERREAQLLEEGIVSSTAEAHAMAAQEAQAAEDAKTAAEKMARAERMAGLAIEFGIRALGEIKNPPVAAAYLAASIAAAAYAGVSRSEAISLQQDRGFTAEENDSLRDGSIGGGGTGGGRRSAGGGGPNGGVIRETVIIIGDVWETPAETARRAMRRQKLGERLDMR